jgi:hypothetical protein
MKLAWNNPNVPAGPFGSLCTLTQTRLEDAQLLQAMAADFGFPVP